MDCEYSCNHFLLGVLHGQQGTTVAPGGLQPGKTIPVTEACACYTSGNLEGMAGVELDPECYIQRCDTCEWIYEEAIGLR